MNEKEAYIILENAINASVLKGVYNLPDITLIINALNILNPLNK